MEYENVIEMRHISKSFPGIKANDDISLTLRKGEIHALLGENGAGKSTLMSILFGMYQPDEGEIFVNGVKQNIKNPNDATRLGIGMVHQHFKLVENYTALQNIILGFEPTKFGILRPKIVRKTLEGLCEKLNFKINLDDKIEDMPVGQQQKVEILKMLYRNNNILILDEPTAVLTPQEIDELMESMKELTKEGKSILFISHKLKEIMNVSDRVTVLQRGKCIGTVNTKDTTEQELSRMMVGRDVELVLKKNECQPKEPILTVNNLSIYNYDKKRETVHNVSFNVRAGEIVCVAGIEGNGQTDLIYGITGLEKVKSGEIILHNSDAKEFIARNELDTKPGMIKDFFENIKNYIELGWYHLSYHFAHFKYFIKKGLSFAMFFAKKLILRKNDEFKYDEFPKIIPYNQIKNQGKVGDIHLERLSIRDRNVRGVAHIPEDRHKHGLVLDFNLRDNLVLDTYYSKQFQKFGFINNKAKAEYAKKLIELYDVRSGKGIDTIVRSMSGGNQQKAIISRELERKTPLLIAVQPTRGLDVGAIEAIHHQILKARDEGNAVLLVSLELDEVMNLADRIIVMYNGEIVGQFNSKDTTANELGLYMSGAKRDSVNAIL